MFLVCHCEPEGRGPDESGLRRFVPRKDIWWDFFRDLKKRLDRDFSLWYYIREIAYRYTMQGGWMRQYTDLFKALSDETRLRIIILLSEKELCVCQIEAALSLPQAKVSRHLAVLRYAGLVRDRRDGLWIYYSLTEPRNKVEENLFQCFRECLRKEKFFRADLLSMKKCVAQPLDIIAEMVRKS